MQLKMLVKKESVTQIMDDIIHKTYKSVYITKNCNYTTIFRSESLSSLALNRWKVITDYTKI